MAVALVATRSEGEPIPLASTPEDQMARKNPTTKMSAPKDEVVEGVDRLPIASGVNSKALDQANEMPEANMSRNDGDNPVVADAPFANGKDLRSFGASPRSNPFPAMPGAA